MARFTKKKLIAATTAMFVVCAAGGAIAYWTQSGTGSGTGTTGTTIAVTVNQTTVVTGLAPGVTETTLAGNFDNPNSGPVKVGSVTTTGLVVSDPHATAGCLAAWYTLGGTAPVDAEIAAGNGVGAWTGLTVALTNNGVNQDSCKGATVTISYNVSAAA